MRGLERTEAAGDSGPACGGITSPSEGIQKAGSGVQKATGGLTSEYSSYSRKKLGRGE